MLNIASKFVYKAFGFTVLSELTLPELSKLDPERHQIDIYIRLSDLSKKWSELSEPESSFVVKEQLIMFQISNVAIFSIEDGKKIVVSPIGNTNEDLLRLYILGTCMGAVLLQRQILPLHGSAIAINGKAYAIVGDSGAGKSTLASAFLQKGYQLISDDVIPVTLSNENIPFVTPAYPQQKLWEESLSAFGLSSENLRPIVKRETKFAVPVTEQFVECQLPLSGIIELVKTRNDRITFAPIKNIKRLYTLFYHTYRNFLVAPSGQLEWHFALTAKLAANIEMFQICRPNSQFTAHELTSLILSTINKGEKS